MSHLDLFLWRFSTLEFGADPLTSSGLCLPRTVRANMILCMEDQLLTVFSPMRHSNKPSHCQHRPQHLVRCHDHLDPHAHLPQVPIAPEAQDRPHWCLCSGCLYSMRPFSPVISNHPLTLLRSFPPSLASSIASTNPSAPTGPSGTSESRRRPSSRPTFPTSGPSSAVSSTSAPSTARHTASARPIHRLPSDPTLPITVPVCAPRSGPKEAPCTASTARSRSTPPTRCLSRSTRSTRSRSAAKKLVLKIDEVLRVLSLATWRATRT